MITCKLAGWTRKGARVAVAASLGAVLGAVGTSDLAARQVAEQSATYARDIAPILQEKCQTCHQPGSIGPMSFMTYEEVLPWAPLILDHVASRSMPPFPVDGTVGIQEFKNDVRLSDEEIRLVERWVEEGAPLGDINDLPPAVEWPDPITTWVYESQLGGPPDLILESPAYMVTATGMDHWPTMVNDVVGLEEERFIRAIEIKPANLDSRRVFHHGNPNLIQDGRSTGLIASAVQTEGQIFPADAGKLIKPGSQVEWGMHYFPVGHDVEAVMKLGLWFYDKGNEPPFETPGQVQHRTDTSTGAGGYPGHSRQISRRADILIPPHGQALSRGLYVLDKPARIHDLRGHLHVRGKYQVLEVVYPDGRWEIINKLDWDDAWHTTFIYEDHAAPLLPKGTVMILTSVWDNTANLKSNPDPDQWVVAGSRSVDEMAHMWVGMTYFENEEDFERLVAERERLLAEREERPEVRTASSQDP